MEAKPAKCAASTAKRPGNTYKPSENPDITIQNKLIPVFPRDRYFIQGGPYVAYHCVVIELTHVNG